ncbi:MAG TPA: hypothetical protein VNT58_03425 [Gaiellaceae bacterium]|nr:hypothetical protein [Gaiellaceae bacterium]
MDDEPTDEELRRFIVDMLSNLDRQLREDEVIDEALSSQRQLWVALYLASRDAQDGDPFS